MNCLITGASLGIGASLALNLASLGYDLFLTYYSNEKLCKKLQEKIKREYHVKCFIQKCDLRKEEEIKNVIFSFFKNLGEINILVNNASTSSDNLFMEKSKEEFMDVLEVNLLGTFLMSKHAISIMNQEGIIINLASTDGIDTYSLYNIDYAVSKAGIIQLTKSMSLIFDTLKIIAIAPNWVDTESTREMNQAYLKQELERINQKQLIPKERIVEVIIDVMQKKEIRSGEVIKIYE